MKLLKRVCVAVIGGTVLIIGILMIVLPGPAIIVIPIGLGILAIEFAWARHWLQKIRDKMPQSAQKHIDRATAKVQEYTSK